MSEEHAIDELDYAQVTALDVLASALVLAGGTPRAALNQHRRLQDPELRGLVKHNPTALGQAFVAVFTNDVLTLTKVLAPDRALQTDILDRLRPLWAEVRLPEVTVGKEGLAEAMMSLARLMALKVVNGTISISLKTRVRQDIGPIQRTVDSLVTLRSLRARGGAIVADEEETTGPTRPPPGAVAAPAAAAPVVKPVATPRLAAPPTVPKNLELAHKLAQDAAPRKSSIEQVDAAKAARSQDKQSSALDEGKNVAEGTRVVLLVSPEEQLRSFLEVSHMIDRQGGNFRVFPDPNSRKNPRVIFEQIAGSKTG